MPREFYGRCAAGNAATGVSQRRRDAESAEAVRGGFALRTDFIVTHKQGFISGGQPPVKHLYTFYMFHG